MTPESLLDICGGVERLQDNPDPAPPPRPVDNEWNALQHKHTANAISTIHQQVPVVLSFLQGLAQLPEQTRHTVVQGHHACHSPSHHQTIKPGWSPVTKNIQVLGLLHLQPYLMSNAGNGADNDQHNVLILEPISELVNPSNNQGDYGERIIRHPLSGRVSLNGKSNHADPHGPKVPMINNINGSIPFPDGEEHQMDLQTDPTKVRPVGGVMASDTVHNIFRPYLDMLGILGDATWSSMPEVWLPDILHMMSLDTPTYHIQMTSYSSSTLVPCMWNTITLTGDLYSEQLLSLDRDDMPETV